jgi:ABC-2 type transport system ATP-binding protein
LRTFLRADVAARGATLLLATHDIDAVPGTELVGVEGGGVRQRLAFSPSATTAAAVLAAVSGAAAVRDLSVEEPDIEDVVRRLYLSSGR